MLDRQGEGRDDEKMDERGDSEVSCTYFFGSELTVILLRVYHGRFASLEVIELVVVLISKKMCFEMIIPKIWVPNPWTQGCHHLRKGSVSSDDGDNTRGDLGGQ